MKYKYLIAILVFGIFKLSSQEKQEREYRIKKSQFPVMAIDLIDNKLIAVKKIKYYKAIDSAKISFEAKFKKDRLCYIIEFNEEGVIEDIEITIKAIDIPNDSYANIVSYLENNFSSYKIQKIQQQYSPETTVEQTLKNAFQNLIIPSLNYKIIVVIKKNNAYPEFEILFNAEGTFQKSKKIHFSKI